MLNKLALPMILLVFVVSAIGQAQADERCHTTLGSVVAADGVVNIDGAIDDELVQCARTALAGTVRRVVVKSTGGYSAPAIALGRLIAQKDVMIEVNELCIAECANFILPAGRIVSVHDSDLILFNGTGTSMLALIGNRDWKAAAIYRKEAANEAEYYSERKIDQRLLWFPQLAVNTRCLFRNKGLDDVNHVIPHSQFTVAVIPKPILQQFGYRIQGEFADTLTRVIGQFEGGAIPLPKKALVGMFFISRGPAPEDMLKEVPECGSDR
jgi:hypothetical protein